MTLNTALYETLYIILISPMIIVSYADIQKVSNP